MVANLPLQQGLTKHIIEALGHDSKFSTPTNTPADTAALGKDVDRKEASGSINYASVIGMLLYLGQSCPDISFAMHQCVGYTHSPKQSHEDVIKRIVRYLKGTLNKGLILTPSCSLKMDRHLQKNKNYTRHRQLPLSNICTHVTNSHTISHSTFDNIKFVLLYGRAVVAERRQKWRQLLLCGRGHSSAAPALPGGSQKTKIIQVTGTTLAPLPLLCVRGRGSAAAALPPPPCRHPRIRHRCQAATKLLLLPHCCQCHCNRAAVMLPTTLPPLSTPQSTLVKKTHLT
jgi:hypothetical protein